jgi:hypothetical protein
MCFIQQSKARVQECRWPRSHTLRGRKVSEERGSVNYEGPFYLFWQRKMARTVVQPHTPQRRKTRSYGMFLERTCDGCQRLKWLACGLQCAMVDCSDSFTRYMWYRQLILKRPHACMVMVMVMFGRGRGLSFLAPPSRASPKRPSLDHLDLSWSYT